jgi:hypothetical protein
MNISADTLALIRSEIGDFTISQVGGRITLRFGFWKRVNLYQLQDILGSQAVVFEDDYDDGECLIRWSYKLA